jgi:hypothetical protein
MCLAWFSGKYNYKIVNFLLLSNLTLTPFQRREEMAVAPKITLSYYPRLPFGSWSKRRNGARANPTWFPSGPWTGIYFLWRVTHATTSDEMKYISEYLLHIV